MQRKELLEVAEQAMDGQHYSHDGHTAVSIGNSMGWRDVEFSILGGPLEICMSHTKTLTWDK